MEEAIVLCLKCSLQNSVGFKQTLLTGIKSFKSHFSNLKL